MGKARKIELFVHTAPRDLDSARDCKDADKLCRRTVIAVQSALSRNNSGYAPLLTSEFLEQQLTTHEAIRALNRSHYKADGLMADSYSLLREQVERVFSIAYITRVGGEACRRFLVDSWFKCAFEMTVQEIELEQTDMFTKNFDSQRQLLQFLAKVNGLPDDELARVRQVVEGGGVPGPKDPFPTPGSIREDLAGSDVGAVLRRAYAEYARLCGCTHSGMSKFILRGMHQKRSGELDLTQLGPIRQAVDRVLSESEVYVALGCAVALHGCGSNVDALMAVETMWNEIEPTSMIATAYWKLGVEALLPKSAAITV